MPKKAKHKKTKTSKKVATKRATKKLTKKKVNSQWPNQRSILWRPERLAYIHKKEPYTDCVFCSAFKKGTNAESLVLFQNELVSVVLNKYPYNNGHLLILPKRHIRDLSELNHDEYTELHLKIKQTIELLSQGYGKSPHGYNVGLNLGDAAGAGIPGHLHYHVVPRWKGDSNFFPLIGQTKVLSETLEQTYKRLLPYINDVY